MADYQMQSNSLRGEYLHAIVDKTVKEIVRDIAPMFGPGATDAYITKNNAPYYTRDGMEVMESLKFDNELANYVHHVLFQAAFFQGETVGDGTTTLELVYGLLYLKIRQILTEADNVPYGIQIGANSVFSKNINHIRRKWKGVIGYILNELKEYTQPMTYDKLLSMLYTCTQDPELAVKLYDELREPIMAGSYIIPRQSNIATDLQVNVHQRPVLKVTKQFSLRPVKDEIANAFIYYCNGTLDVARSEIFAMMMSHMVCIGDIPLDGTYVIICNGISDATRNALKELVRVAKMSRWDLNNMNNIVIYSLDEYRKFSNDDIEDLSTIITDEIGIGGLIQPLTYEALLYHTFYDPESFTVDDTSKFESLDAYDMDPHLIERMKEIYLNPGRIIIDEKEGIAIDREFGPNAKARYEELLQQIKDEKSPVKKVDLNKRLRRTYGMFIDIEVGAEMLKDGQRRFELILDAILSAATGVREGVLTTNAILTVLDILSPTHLFEDPESEEIASTLYWVFEDVFCILVNNYVKGTALDSEAGELVDKCSEANKVGDKYFDIHHFNLKADAIWPRVDEHIGQEPVKVGDITIDPTIVEPVGIIESILNKSISAVELAKTEVFHISANGGFMQNYVQ